jgi:LacI family transcriptional regulator
MTIKDLVKESGYSLGTVSRVLNNQPNVSEKARETILAVVKKSGFELNTNAQTLKQQKSNSILVVVKGTSNELFGALVERLQSLFSATSHPLIVVFIDEDDNEAARAAQLCRERKPAGVLFLGGSNRNFTQSFAPIHVPAVVVTNDAAKLPFENLSSVTTDDCRGAACAVEYLLRSGHRAIGVLGGDRKLSDTSLLRYEGCLEAFRRNGRTFDEARYYETGRYSYEFGYNGMKSLLKKAPEITAVFAMADVIAIGAIRALYDEGLRVPDDLSVIGYDGLKIGGFYLPKLSTITQSVEMLATRSFELIMACVEKDAPARHITVPFTLSCRESVKKLST